VSCDKTVAFLVNGDIFKKCAALEDFEDDAEKFMMTW